jgi:CubicO group peptidase (beta-lactamase class C family)
MILLKILLALSAHCFALQVSIERRSDPLHAIEPLVLEAIDEGKMPGAVICIGHQKKIVYLKAFGNRQVGDAPQVMTIDTVFDIASLTKPVATATSLMKMVEDGQIQLASKVVDVAPEFSPHGKDKITIQDLLVHQSGLIPDNPISDYVDGPDLAWKRICDLKLIATVGKEFKYSDVNFIVLAKVIEKVSGQNVHEFSHEQIFAPLGMNETGYNPAEDLKQRSAPTEKRDGQWMRGVVHDPRAFELSGIAGHAGLFSTAKDLAVYAQMMLGNGEFKRGNESIRVLSPQTVKMMTSDYPVSSGIRGLGWDKQSPFSSNRGDRLSPSAFGHGGFTGTVLWIDPELDLFFIFLSNRVHPNGKGNVNPLAGQILNIVADSGLHSK